MVEKVELKEIINQIRGVSYGKNDVSDTKVDGYVPVLRSNNIQDSKIDLSDLVYVKPEKIKPVQFLKKGDILITASTGSLKVIGKNAQCKDDLNASFGAFCKVVRVKNANHSYLGHLFQSPQYFSYIQNIVNGANINNIKNEHIDNFKLPLPPLKTQQKIAQILDNAAALRNKTAQLIEEYNLLAQSIFLELFGDPVVNKMKWDELKMVEICSKVTDGTHDTPERLANGIKFITGKHIRPYKIDYNNSDYVTNQVHQEIYKRCNPEKNDVLYTNIGVNLGTAALNTVDYEFSMKNVALLKPIKSKVIGRYLEYFLNSKNMKEKILWISSIGGAQKFLSLNELRKLKVLVPPIKLQTQFAQKTALIERQKALARQELKESEDLFNCLLQKAFKGEL